MLDEYELIKEVNQFLPTFQAKKKGNSGLLHYNKNQKER